MKGILVVFSGLCLVVIIGCSAEVPEHSPEVVEVESNGVKIERTTGDLLCGDCAGPPAYARGTPCYDDAHHNWSVCP
jgi:hypothetical protein